MRPCDVANQAWGHCKVSTSLGPKSMVVRDVAGWDFGMMTQRQISEPKDNNLHIIYIFVNGGNLFRFYLFNDVSQLLFRRPTLNKYASSMTCVTWCRAHKPHTLLAIQITGSEKLEQKEPYICTFTQKSVEPAKNLWSWYSTRTRGTRDDTRMAAWCVRLRETATGATHAAPCHLQGQGVELN